MAGKGTLTVRILGDAAPLEKSLTDVSNKLSGWAKGAVGIFAGLGVAAGAVLANEFGDALAKGRMQDKLAAQLDLTEEEAKKAGKIAGDLYVNAYGDSLEEVHDAVGAVMSSLGDLDDSAVKDLTARALDLAAAFDVDVNQSVTAAGVLLETGLARDGVHAFDLLVAGMQRVPAEMRGELIPIVEEYAQDFAALGIEGDDAFALLVDAASKGRFELDKTGDALKELTIRATDLSTTSRDAYRTIGLDAEEMAGKIVQGGEQARGAFDQIIDGLLAIDDPATRANTAIDLMGGPLEDLSVTEIPEFLRRLDEMGAGFESVEGKSTEMGITLNDNVATDIESWKRRAGAAIDSWLYENVLPMAEQVTAAFEEDGIGGALDKALELWEQAQPKINRWWTGTVVPWWEGTAVPWMAYIGGEMGTALVNGLVDVLVNGIPKIGEMILRQFGGWVGPQLSFDDVFGTIDVPNISNPADRPPTPTLSGGTGSGGGGSLVRMHTGGEVLASFPRAAGLRADERMIKAQVGETVIPRGGPGMQPIEHHWHFHGNVFADKRQLQSLIQEMFRDYARRNGNLGLT